MLRSVVFGLALSLAPAMAAAHDLANAPEKPRDAHPPQDLQIIDLGKEIPGMAGRRMRMRKVTLEPGGALPPHGHADRPAIVYVLQGRAREHRSGLDAPLEYGAGDSMTENAAIHHWIENIGDEPLIGVVVDLPNEGGAPALPEEEILKAYGLEKHVHE